MDDFFNPGASESDPASDFLQRERAAGIDEFGGIQGGSFDHDFEQSAAAFPDLDGDDDLNSFVSAPAPSSAAPLPPAPAQHQSSTYAPTVSVTNDNEFAAFEQDYPEVEIEPQHLPAPLHTNNGFSSTPSYQQPASLFQGTPQPVEEESEFIRSWKVKQAEEISRREEESTKKKEDTIVKARLAIDNFYKDYNSKKEKNIATNKEEEEAFNSARTDALAKGTTWDRICALVDLQDSRSKTTTKSKTDLARFKEILLALKREGDSAPGAGGY